MASDLLSMIRSLFDAKDEEPPQPELLLMEDLEDLPAEIGSEIVADLALELDEHPAADRQTDEEIIAEIAADVTIEIDDEPQPLLGEPMDEVVIKEIMADASTLLIDEPLLFLNEPQDAFVLAEIMADREIELEELQNTPIILGQDLPESEILDEIQQDLQADDYTPVFEPRELSFDDD